MDLNRISAAVIGMIVAAFTASAQPVLITAPATVGPLDTMITPTGGGTPVPLATAEITVEGTTLTMNGRHTVASLAIVRNGTNQPGILTHGASFSFDYSGVGTDIVIGAHLIVAGDVFVQGVDGPMVDSQVDLNGRGFTSDMGPGAGTLAAAAGGGSHGGAGSRSATGVLAGATYGSFTGPVTMGSGGGRDTSITNSGGVGGGVLRLTVQGILTVDGTMSANGLIGTAGDSGGGAGGSIWIDASTLNGTGLITANGGPGRSSGGAGGGGRVAVLADASSFDDTSIRAYGGASTYGGAAGTVYRRLSSSSPEVLVIDNGNQGFFEAITEMSGEVVVPQDLLVRNNGRLGPPRGDVTLALDVLGDAVVTASGFLFADGRGFTSDMGPGAGTLAAAAGGGSHGGAGSRSATGILAGTTYGSFTAPVTMGSGGGRDTSITNSGGAGGGVLRLSVDGTLTVDGTVSANGLIGSAGDCGGGAGGSIWLEAGSFDGAGLITANGGPGRSSGGAGGGGRVAVLADASTFDDTSIRAYGGDSTYGGAAGTVFRRLSASSPAVLVIDNGNQAFFEAITEMTGEVIIPGDVLIRNNGRLGPPRGDATLALDVLGDAVVTASGLLFADGRGFTSDMGPGAGTLAAAAGGASHGGAGSRSATGILAGTTYGSFTAPVTMGSGGGRDTSITNSGGAGGGVLRLTVQGILTVDGTISANGLIGGSGDPGGGAGGSIWIDAGTLDGVGVITANGGPGRSSGGAGGGGRVAVYVDASTMGDAQIRAYGGASTYGGAAGTVYRRLSAASPEVLVIDNGNQAFFEAITEMTGEVIIPGDVLVRNNGRLGPPRGDATLALDVLGDAVVTASGLLFADGRGFTSDMGPGAGTLGSSAGGGGHGGRGANAAGGAAGGSTYGSEQAPVMMGSGGGRDTSISNSGGSGGGVLRLTVQGVLTVDGTISANGLIGGSGDPGGGAGGSIIVSAGTIDGLGTLTANGGPGRSSGGSGGGGRIAIYACAFDMMTSQVVATGNVSARPGEDGTVFFGTLAIGPDSVRACDRSDVMLSVIAQAGGGSNGYQWQLEGEDLIDGVTPFGSVIVGSDTDTLTISGITVFDIGLYTCISDGLCGIAESNAVFVSVCPSDFNCDGITDILDFLDFFQDFSACEQQAGPCGDLGNGDINGDTIVDILDFLDFLQYFSEGC